jgi:hypothetical protein
MQPIANPPPPPSLPPPSLLVRCVTVQVRTQLEASPIIALASVIDSMKGQLRT